MELKRALDKCMHICSQREYCEYDISEKLKKWEVALADQKVIIDKLVEEKFIDHNRYVPAFINDKFKFNNWGKIKIQYYLKQKRIDTNTIITFLDQIDENQYKGTILKEIAKKSKSTKGESQFERNQKIARYVISKGFEPSLVFDLLKLA